MCCWQILNFWNFPIHTWFIYFVCQSERTLKSTWEREFLPTLVKNVQTHCTAVFLVFLCSEIHYIYRVLIERDDIVVVCTCVVYSSYFPHLVLLSVEQVEWSEVCSARFSRDKHEINNRFVGLRVSKRECKVWILIRLYGAVSERRIKSQSRGCSVWWRGKKCKLIIWNNGNELNDGKDCSPLSRDAYRVA